MNKNFFQERALELEENYFSRSHDKHIVKKSIFENLILHQNEGGDPTLVDKSLLEEFKKWRIHNVTHNF